MADPGVLCHESQSSEAFILHLSTVSLCKAHSMVNSLVYTLDAEGILVPNSDVLHRDDEYDSELFPLMMRMQREHFWYLGRYRFLSGLLNRLVEGRTGLSAVDLGGGTGSWVHYLQQHHREQFAELALADSSKEALRLAAQIVEPGTQRFQVDVTRPGWSERWDTIFLLDVLEHLPDDISTMQQVAAALKPGGLAVVTMPAIQRLWSYNDDIVHHLRRYNIGDMKRMADQTGMQLVDARYFNFFLSPLLVLSRMRRPSVESMGRDELRALLERTHRVPGPIVNQTLRLIFSAETPLGLKMPFPWGTSIAGVFRRQ